MSSFFSTAFTETGIDGLDVVLKGGVSIEGSSYPSIIITGPAGAGKSILGLTLASKIAGSAMVVLREERPSDFEMLSSKLGLLSKTGKEAVLDNNYNNELILPPTINGDCIVFSYFPDEYIRLKNQLNRNDASTNNASSTLYQHIARRLKIMNNKCKVVVVDSLWQIGPSEFYAFNDSAGLTQPSFEKQRLEFKNMCELSSANNTIFITIIENDGKRNIPDWREYVADIVIRLHVLDGAKNRVERYLQISKTRYQASMDGFHSFVLRSDGIKVFPNSFSVLNEVGSDTANNLQEANEVKTESDFAFGGGFNEFLPEGIGLGSATLIYGDDQTRKRLTAVRFIQQAFAEEPSCEPMIVSVGTGKKAFERVLDKYWYGAKLSKPQVQIIESPIDELWDVHSVGRFIGRLNEEIKKRVRKGVRIKRVVVDDIAAMAHWSEFVPPLKQLFAHYSLTSLFVHTLEREEQHQHRVMFDTIIRTKRFTQKGRDSGPFFAYHKTKENSVSPKDQCWFQFKFKKSEVGEVITLDKLDDYYLTRNHELQLPGPKPQTRGPKNAR